MKELTVEELESKLKQVDADINLLRSSGGASRKIEVLSEYKEFLEEDLKNARTKKEAQKN